MQGKLEHSQVQNAIATEGLLLIRLSFYCSLDQFVEETIEKEAN